MMRTDGDMYRNSKCSEGAWSEMMSAVCRASSSWRSRARARSASRAFCSVTSRVIFTTVPGGKKDHIELTSTKAYEPSLRRSRHVWNDVTVEPPMPARCSSRILSWRSCTAATSAQWHKS